MEIYFPLIGVEMPIVVMKEIATELGIRVDARHIGRPRIRKCAPGADGLPHQHYRVRLYPVTETLRALALTLTPGKVRRLNAVCWHGHRDFMKELFESFPNATLRSALAEYNGRRSFALTHEDTLDTPWNRDQTCNCDPFECSHEWIAGMMHVADEDLEAVSAVRKVECLYCEKEYGKK